MRNILRNRHEIYGSISLEFENSIRIPRPEEAPKWRELQLIIQSVEEFMDVFGKHFFGPRKRKYEMVELPATAKRTKIQVVRALSDSENDL